MEKALKKREAQAVVIEELCFCQEIIARGRKMKSTLTY